MFHGFLRLFLQPHFFGIENMAKLHFGLQKLTLLDFPGKVACTVFTFGCNFRCPFCHNASLVHREGEEETAAEFWTESALPGASRCVIRNCLIS